MKIQMKFKRSKLLVFRLDEMDLLGLNKMVFMYIFA